MVTGEQVVWPKSEPSQQRLSLWRTKDMVGVTRTDPPASVTVAQIRPAPAPATPQSIAAQPVFAPLTGSTLVITGPAVSTLIWALSTCGLVFPARSVT